MQNQKPQPTSAAPVMLNPPTPPSTQVIQQKTEALKTPTLPLNLEVTKYVQPLSQQNQENHNIMQTNQICQAPTAFQGAVFNNYN